ncbi:MAG: hypothetical protein RR745_06275, partial [Bacilli bacterium]
IMYGYAKANTESIISGTTDVVTASSGSKTSNTDGKNVMKYRGIENIYGNVWQFIDGVNIDNVDATNAYFYVNRDATTYASDIINGKYTKVGYKKLNAEGWVTKMGYDPDNPFIQMPQELNGNVSTKYGDYYWMTTTTDKKTTLFGGFWADSTDAGISNFDLDYSSSVSAYFVGSRLLKTAL